MKSTKGFTSIFLIVTTLFVFILVGTIFAVLNSHINLLARELDKIKAYNMAEAGLARGIIQLRTGILDPINDSLDNGTYSVSIVQSLPVPVGRLPGFVVTSTGSWGTTSRTLSLEVFQKSFAQWQYFTDNEIFPSNPGLFGMFTSADRIDGPVHTNGQLGIGGSPTFEGHVSAVNPAIRGSQTASFNSGITIPASSIQIPSAPKVMTPIMNAALLPGGLSLYGDTTIEFTDSGPVWVTNAGVANGVRTLKTLPPNGAIYIYGGDLKISGTLNGKVTIGVDVVWTMTPDLKVSAVGGNITIVDALKYAGPRDVNNLPTSPDNMLGLMAAKDVTSKTTCGYQEIDAYIVALDGSFRDANSSQSSGFTVPPPFGWPLTVYGGIMQKNRGDLLYDNTGGPARFYHYDKRMKYDAPLFSPQLTDSLGVVYAKRIWKDIT